MNKLFLLLLLGLPAGLRAQTTQDSLREVEVKSHRNASTSTWLLRQNTGRVQTFDSTQLELYQGQSVAALIGTQSPVFIKSYGFNSLSTLSFRGASAAQSLVLWNGVPVNNPALGVADLSLLPVFFADEISIAYGGSSALLGNGNVGGALLLDQEPPSFSKKKKEAGVYLAAGSFGQKLLGVNLKGDPDKKGRWQFSLRALGQLAENDFPYQDEAGATQRMHHARQQSGQLFLAAARQVKGGYISVKAWGQSGWREIPPALFESQSLKKQTDQALRLVADWQLRSNNLKLAYSTEGMDYEDKAIGLRSQAITRRLFLSDTWRKSWQEHELTLMLPLQMDWLAGSGYRQSQLALAAFYQYQKKRWQISVQGRAGWYDQRFALTPGLGVSFKIKEWCRIYLSAQRSFRQPTLNELYYQPGGNAQLKPEEGWSGDGGYKIDFKKEQWQISHEGALFARYIQNWIIWYGGAIWTPHNIAAVSSRGAETNTTIHWRQGSFNASFWVQTAYILSTTAQSVNPLDGSVGKQLPYVPRYNYRVGARLGWKSWLLSADYGYTGYRFITSDESQFLAPYDVCGAQLAYGFTLGRQELKLQGSCQNIFDVPYQVVAFRPMPGRVWQFSLQARLQ